MALAPLPLPLLVSGHSTPACIAPRPPPVEGSTRHHRACSQSLQLLNFLLLYLDFWRCLAPPGHPKERKVSERNVEMLKCSLDGIGKQVAIILDGKTGRRRPTLRFRPVWSTRRTRADACLSRQVRTVKAHGIISYRRVACTALSSPCQSPIVRSIGPDAH